MGHFKVMGKKNIFQWKNFDNKAHYLLCSVIIRSVKSFNLERHYKTHAAKYDCYLREAQNRKLEVAKSECQQQTNMFICNESKEITMTCSASIQPKAKKLQLSNDAVTQ